MDVNKKLIFKKIAYSLLVTFCLLSYLTLNFSQTVKAQTINGSTVGGTAAINDFYTNDTTFPNTNPPGTSPSPSNDIYNNLSYYYQNYYDTGSCNYSNITHNDEAVELGWLSQSGDPQLNLEGSTNHIPYAVPYIPGTNFKFNFVVVCGGTVTVPPPLTVAPSMLYAMYSILCKLGEEVLVTVLLLGNLI